MAINSILDDVAPTIDEKEREKNLRSFGDIPTTRKRIFDNALNTVQKLEPLSNARYTLKLSDVRYEGPEEYSLQKYKDAILRKGTLTRPLRGNWNLYDNETGQLLEQQKKTIARIPYLSPQGTFVLRGNDYALSNQFRLRPGVFTRVQDNGELEAHVNVAKGRGHRVYLDPESGIFRLKIGQARIPLIDVLRVLGVEHKQIEDVWGKELSQINAAKKDPKAVNKLYSKFTNKSETSATPREKEEAIRAAFSDMVLDPEVVEKTLGRPHAGVTSDTLLDVTRKLLHVSKGKEEPDSRDDLAYQTVWGPEDLIAERLEKSKFALNQLLWKVTNKNSLKAIPTGVLTDAVNSAIMSSGLGSPIEEVNPAEIFDHLTRITRMGESGIPSISSIPDEARSVQPSQLGFVDILRTPECYDGATEVMTDEGWKYWPDVTKEHRLACLIDGRIQFKKPLRLIKKRYFGKMVNIRNRSIEATVTPNHKMYCSVTPSSTDKDFKLIEVEKLIGEDFCVPTNLNWEPWPGDSLDSFKYPDFVKAEDRHDWLTLFCFLIMHKRKNFDGGDSAEPQFKFDTNQTLVTVCALLDKFSVSYKKYQCIYLIISDEKILEYVSQVGGDYCNSLKCILHAPETIRQLAWDLVSSVAAQKDAPLIPIRDRAWYDFVQLLGFSLGKNLVTSYPDVNGLFSVFEDLYIDYCGVQDKSSSRIYTDLRDIPVYCAEVPGNLLFVRHGGPNKFGFWCGNSSKVGVDLRLARAAKKGSDGKIYIPVFDKAGNKVYRSPQELSNKPIAFPGADFDRDWLNDDLDGEDMVPAMVGSKVSYVPKSEIEYSLPDTEDTFSPLSNLIPLKSRIKGQRGVMASRMLTQALPLKNAQAPYVQAGVSGKPDTSFEQLYGNKMGALRAKKPGRVVSVDENSIKVKEIDGNIKEYELYKDHPYNRKTSFTQTAKVAPGDIIKPNQLIATSNFTNQDGETALGLNARVMYLPFRGLNFEDAVVVSESFAKRLSSEQLYQNDIDWEDKHKLGKNTFASLFPKTYERKILEKFKDDGLIKPGTVVNEDEPLILAVREKELSKKMIHRGHKAGFDDASVKWEHTTPGVVVDSVMTPSGANVTVKAYSPAQVGDKVSGRYGDKSIISGVIPDDELPTMEDGRKPEILVSPLGIISRCYDEQTEFLTDTGWKFGDTIQSSDKFACYDTTTENVEFLAQVAPFHSAEYAGKMLHVKNKVLDFCITPNHKMWAVAEQQSDNYWSEYEASKLSSSSGWRLPIVGNPVCGKDSDFELPHLEYSLKDNSSNKENIILDAGDWAEFLGWYLSEGNVDEKVHISQCNKADCSSWSSIESLLKRLPFKWWYNPKDMQFHITSLRLVSYMKQFGKCDEKYIPKWLFNQSYSTRQRFLDSYLAGDGSRDKSHRNRDFHEVSTKSKQLADDVQRLCLMQGIGAIIPSTLNKDGLWRVGLLLKRSRLVRPAQWQSVDYVGKIYCPTVPTGYVVTRRNGKVLIAGNTNPAQIIEAALGKVAEKTGKPYRINDFDNKDAVEYALQELKKHGLKDKESVIDPETGRKIDDVFAGNRFYMKLHHTAEAKGQGRGLGTYSVDMTPAKGGAEGAKRLGMLEVNSLLAGGATQALKDAKLIRGQANPEFWSRFVAGHNPMPTDVPHTYKKFVSQLKASGINIVPEGDKLHIMALTNKDVNRLSEDREITGVKDPRTGLRTLETVNWQEGLEPKKNGLFDKGLTGGHLGSKWSHIKLAAPLPNPVMEEPIRRILGLTQKKFLDVLAGKEQYNGLTGPEAISHALETYNLPLELVRAQKEAKSEKKTHRDKAIKKLGYLKSAQRLGIEPKDWILDKVPVIPPMFRPISLLGPKKLPWVDDPNYLYKELFDSNEVVRGLSDLVDEEEQGQNVLHLYKAFQAVTGLGDPTQVQHKEKHVKGFLKHIFGSSPKLGTVQRKLLGSTTDLVGRAVISPDPNLDMDQVGLPEEKAWTIYKPFLIRKLRKNGYSTPKAIEEIENRSKTARRELLDEMENRPVIINRAPTLHKFGILAAKPILTKGEVLRVSPLIVGGFNADFDGDAMNYHVPVSDDAVYEAYNKLLPSRNLLSVGDFTAIHKPTQDYAGGLYEASAAIDEKKPAKVYRTVKDAIRAFKRGEINSDRKVEIIEEE